MSPFHQVSHHYCISPVSHGLAPPVFTSISPLSISISPVSHRYLTSISRPGAASISPVSHQYFSIISPLSHHYYKLSHINNLAIISPFISPRLITIINLTIMSPIHQYPTINYLTILTLSHQYLTSISRPGAASIHQYLTIINQYLTSISPVSHQYLTAWCRQYLTSISPVFQYYLTIISPLL